ncbi:hypothetical protein [Marinicellulosiphila megalodicopiae]|uniref:hypothetical protein n=1 Tax=Marinicellulosiphila megalodicopiae TaxID=2724896 RepID=UPI003BB07E95
MNVDIKFDNLNDFLLDNKCVDFACYTYESGYRQCVSKENFFDEKLLESKVKYTFKSDFMNPILFPYYVLYIPSKAYLMFERNSETIMVWVCYTEEGSRKNGYMTTLLKKLKLLNPIKVIKIETNSKFLREFCPSIGIKLIKK